MVNVVTGFTAARMLEIENGTVVSGTVNAAGDLILTRRDGGAINAGNVFDVFGFVPDVGSTPPAESEINGKPVLWIKDQSLLTPVPVAPTAPAFDLTAKTVTPPNLVGVQYRVIDGASAVPLAPGVANSLSAFALPFTVKVDAIALPGYVLFSSYLWEKQIIDPANLALYASDSFVGTPEAAFSTGDLVAGRVMDMALGGTASPAPNWYRAGLKIAADGASATKNLTGQDPAWSASAVYMGAYNYGLEVIVKAPFTPTHSRSIRFYAGAINGSLAEPPAVRVEMYINGTQLEARFLVSGTVAAQNIIVRTGMTEANWLGTWKFTWVNKFLQITTPTGEVVGKDFSSSGLTYGQYLGIGAADYGGTKQWSIFDGMKFQR